MEEIGFSRLSASGHLQISLTAYLRISSENKVEGLQAATALCGGATVYLFINSTYILFFLQDTERAHTLPVYFHNNLARQISSRVALALNNYLYTK